MPTTQRLRKESSKKRKKESSSTIEQQSKKKKTLKSKKQSGDNAIRDSSNQDFYFNLWGREVNEDLMQYILDYVPVYPDLLNMRGTNRFWKINLEQVFFPKVRVLDLLTRGKDYTEIIKNNKMMRLASYFPNINKLRVCQPGWNVFFKKPNKIETFEFYDLECVAVSTPFTDILEELMMCHKSNKHASCLKIVNVFGSKESTYCYSIRGVVDYFNGVMKKGQTPLESLESINLMYHEESVIPFSKVRKLKVEKPISNFDNVIEFWDKMVFEENICWTLLHPFKIVEPSIKEELFDLIIEYAKAQDIPIKLCQYSNRIVDSDSDFEEFYKKFVINPDLEEHLRYKFDKFMLDQIFNGGNDHVLIKIIENKDIPLIIEGAKNPLIPLLNDNKMILFKKVLEREPSLLNLGNSQGIIEGTKKEMNLLVHLLESQTRPFYLKPAIVTTITSNIKYLIEIGVDINGKNYNGSILNLLKNELYESLPFFEDIKLETLENRDNINGMSALEKWAKRNTIYDKTAEEFLKFFERVFQKHGKELRNYTTKDGGNLLHVMPSASFGVYEHCIQNLKIDITQKNNHGTPALFIIDTRLFGHNFLELVKKDLDVRDANGRTLLSLAIIEKPKVVLDLIDKGCNLEYALSQVEFRKEFAGGVILESKKGEPFQNGAKLLLSSAFDYDSEYVNVIMQNLDIFKQCLEVEISLPSNVMEQITVTPAYTFLFMEFHDQKIVELGLLTRKHYFLHNGILVNKYTDEKEGVINGSGLASIMGNHQIYYTNRNILLEKSSITQLNSWMLAVKYGHYEIAKTIIKNLEQKMEECEPIINELASSNLQYHILGDSLKLKLKENKLVGDDVKMLSGYIFNFTEFGNFSDLEPFIEDLLHDSETLEQKTIRHLVKRDDSEYEKAYSRLQPTVVGTLTVHTLQLLGKMYNRIHEGVTHQLTMLEVCVLKGYPLKKILDKLKTEKSILQFLSRKDKKTKKPFIHLLCDTSLMIYIGVEKRELHSYKHSVIVSLLSKLSSTCKKQVLNLLDSNNETPIFVAIRGEMKNLVRSLAPNTSMGVRNVEGKTCLDISPSSEMYNILIQYADKKTLATSRQDEEGKKKK